MILDWQQDSETADRHEILDAATGEPLPRDLPIVYADDAAGVLRLTLLGDDGKPFLAYEHDHRTPLREEDCWVRRDGTGKILNPPSCVAWEEVRRDIRIVPKAEIVGAAGVGV